MRTAMRLEKDLAKAGQDRAIPASLAAALAREIKDFLDDQHPLMMLMSCPGIKKVRASSRGDGARFYYFPPPFPPHRPAETEIPEAYLRT